ncbi:MAG TPA: hypothetical protein VD994_06420 [Prosthecobacter sp.]|nr:hypothetical protein [Prosthecobacter sp.]
MIDNRSTSFLQRSRDSSRQAERRALAEWVAKNLISQGARLFVVSGTTAKETAEMILRQVRDVHIQTNSVPVTGMFMQLVEEGLAAPYATVSIIGGEVRPETGAVAGKVEPDAAATLLFSPHGVTEKGLVGNRDVDQIKPLVGMFRRVIMPVSWLKLGAPGTHSIKHFGHWKQVRCHMVVTDTPHVDLGLSEDAVARGNSLLKSVQDAMGERLTISRIPWPEADG